MLAIEEIDSLLSGAFIIITAVETGGIVLKRIVDALTAGKGKFCPGINFIRVTEKVQTVVGIAAADFDSFRFIRSQPLVEDNVCQSEHSMVMKRADAGKVGIFGPVLGSDGAFLIEFTKVIHVVDAIADVMDASKAFVGRRHPDSGYAELFEPGCLCTQAVPEGAVAGRVPVKALVDRWVFIRVKITLHCHEIPPEDGKGCSLHARTRMRCGFHWHDRHGRCRGSC